MCLPETVLLVEAHGEGVERWGTVTREGHVQEVGLAFVPEANVGDILMVHSGQAFRILLPDPEGADRGTAGASTTPS